MELLIKGMVCNRCIYVIDQEMSLLGIEVNDIQLGRIVLKNPADAVFYMNKIKLMLLQFGFELIFDKNQQVVQKIKEYVELAIAMQVNLGVTVKIATFLNEKMNKTYDSLSAIFSSLEATTLEKYVISRRIEKVKDMLVTTEMSLTEISYVLGYSSQAYLSNQLKKHTGFTSSHFKQIRNREPFILKNSFDSGK